MSGHRHRKRFGQHFLHDPTILFALAEVIDPRSDDVFVEIGPGEGVLTQQLLGVGARVIAIEIDRDLALKLRAQAWDNFEVIESDVLQVDFAALSASGLRCVGNLPYNISTPLLFHCFDYLDLWSDMHFLLQKEVVLRLAAQPGSSHYSRLSVMAQAVSTVTALFEVPPESFDPPPKVDSQLIRLVPKKQSQRDFCLQRLSTVVQTAFAHRRKTLHNNFKHQMSALDWQELDIDPSLRAQVLSVDDFIRMANYLGKKHE